MSYIVSAACVCATAAGFMVRNEMFIALILQHKWNDGNKFYNIFSLGSGRCMEHISLTVYLVLFGLMGRDEIYNRGI